MWQLKYKIRRHYECRNKDHADEMNTEVGTSEKEVKKIQTVWKHTLGTSGHYEYRH